MSKSPRLMVPLLLGALFLAASGDHEARAQGNNQQRPPGYIQVELFFRSIFDPAFVAPTQLQDATTAYHQAVDALHREDARAYNRAVHRLGKVESLTLDLDVARYANFLLRALPDRFVRGFVFRNPDGTVVGDPDPFIRWQLQRAGLTAWSGGDGGRD